MFLLFISIIYLSIIMRVILLRWKISLTQISKHRAVAVQPFDVIGETIFGDLDQKPFRERSHVTSIVEKEVDLCIIATYPMAEIAHAKV